SASNGARYSRRGDRSAASEPRSTYHEWYVILDDVPWGVVELEPEVATWIGSLFDEEFGRVEFYIDLLEEKGVRLREPFTRQLRGKLRELGSISDRAAMPCASRTTSRRAGGSSCSRSSRSNADASGPRSIG